MNTRTRAIRARCASLAAALVALLGAISARAEDRATLAPVPIGADCTLHLRAEDEVGRCWFRRCGEQPEQALGCDLSAMRQVVSVLAAPACDRLAVLSVGEGHPWLEVVDLTVLREQGMYRVLHEVNPYPLGVEVVGWQGRDLGLISEVALDTPPDEAVGIEARILEQRTGFVLREDGTISRSQDGAATDPPCHQADRR